MTVMTYDVITDILGKGFGDSQWRTLEEVAPLLGFVNPRWNPRHVLKTIRIFLEYGLLRRRLDGKIKGYSEYQLTEKGLEALDLYRNFWNRPLSSDPDRIKKLRDPKN